MNQNESFWIFLQDGLSASFAAMTLYDLVLWFAWFAVITVAAVISTGRTTGSRAANICYLIGLVSTCIPLAFVSDFLSPPNGQQAAVFGIAIFFLSRLTWKNLTQLHARPIK